VKVENRKITSRNSNMANDKLEDSLANSQFKDHVVNKYGFFIKEEEMKLTTPQI
jgi:hypothetical protein